MRKLILALFLASILLEPALAHECEAPSSGTSLDLEISALYPNPNTGESEWVELRNLGSDPIDLSLYTLEDATAKPWTLSGTLEETVEITGFPFQLNNTNETVTLKTLDGTVVDTFEYASSTKGKMITKASTETQTGSESTSTETAPSVSTSTPTTPSAWVIFSEALPNPAGSDSTEEWIELYNPYGETLILEGLFLDDEEDGSSPYALTGTLSAESYLLVKVTDSKITLNNDADHLRLLGVNSEILWDISYSSSKEGLSYAWFGDYYDWTEEPTPGEENVWSGTVETGAVQGTSDQPTEPVFQNGDLSDEVGISEVYPNPEGPDNEEEWIEITNLSDTALNLGNWILDDGEGGSDPYIFPDTTVIQPSESLIIYRTESEIALNNTNEIVQLSDYTGEVMSEVTYESSEENQSYSEIQVEEVQSVQASASGLANRVFTTWQWVTPSPGAMNPVWKQIKGEVLEWDGALLTLFDGVSTWTFKVSDEKTTDTLLYKVGNMLLVQAESQDGMYEIKFSELLENVNEAAKSSFPWSWIVSGLLGVGWASYEVYKRRKIKNNLVFQE